VVVGSAEGKFVGGIVHWQKSKMSSMMSKISPVADAYAQSVRFKGFSPSLGKMACIICPSGCWNIQVSWKVRVFSPI